MSRTYRYYRLDHYDKKWFKEAKEAVENGTARSWDLYIYNFYTYKYKGDKHNSTTLPRHFRKEVNRKRRMKDKNEVFKAVNIEGYEELCSNWNCKDNES